MEQVTAKPQGWIGVDLDGTLAEYIGDMSYIGKPILPMLNRVKKWIANGREVRIFTARAGDEASCEQIRIWLRNVGLPELPITNKKDFSMVALWDDRAVQVICNTGEVVMPPYNRGDNIQKTREGWRAAGVSQEQFLAGVDQLLGGEPERTPPAAG